MTLTKFLSTQILYSLIATSLLLTPFQARAEVNLLMNGSFEGDFGWKNAYTGAGYATVMNDDQLALDGSRYLKIYDPSTTASEGLLSPEIDVTVGTKYTARTMVYRISSHAPHLYVKYYAADGTEIASTATSADGPSYAWYSVSLETRAPIGAATARILLYSLTNRTVSARFDNVEFTRAPSQGLVKNQDFEGDAIGPGYPANWWKWNTDYAPISVVVDPFDSNNRVLKIADSSTTLPGTAQTRFSVSGGLDYRITARILAESGTQAGRLFVKFYDKNGVEVLSDSRAPASISGVWESMDFIVRAPAAAESAMTLLSCTQINTCTTYFDDIEIKEHWDETNRRYVSANGMGSGLSSTDPAKYNAEEFWVDVENALEMNPIHVEFESETYPISTFEDRLRRFDCGNSAHRLVVAGKNGWGTDFVLSNNYYPGPITDGLVREKLRSLEHPMMTWSGCTNITLKNFTFTDDDTLSVTVADALHINASGKTSPEIPNGIQIVGIKVRDIEPTSECPPARSYDENGDGTTQSNEYFHYCGIEYSGLKLAGNLENAIVEHSEFIRSGRSNGFHHIYAFGASSGTAIRKSFFEDSRGHHVKIRKSHSKFTVSDSMFSSTDEDSNSGAVFIALDANNVKAYNNEWFGDGYRFYGNVFSYEDNPWDAIKIIHKGHNPTDNAGVTWPHILSEGQKACMDDLAQTECRKYVMEHSYGLPTNNAHDGICLSGNTFENAYSHIALFWSDGGTRSGEHFIADLFDENACR